jgi:tetratricopeptide (TPR) repeat protein
MSQWVLAIAGLIAIASPAYASTESRALTKEAFTRAYELRFADSLALLAEARRSDPSDPAPVRAAAAVTWMQILFAQGVATFAAFDGDASGDAVSRPAAPPDLAQRFLADAADAVRLAQRRVTASPEDLDAHYQLGASVGLLALYRGTVEGRTFAAFTEGRRAVGIMDRIRQKDPAHRESALIPGIYRYAVSTLSWPRRMLAAAAGLPGDRDGGIRLLDTAAAESAETATDAALVLMIVFNREGRHADATRHLQRLLARHPGNRLLRLNLAATALDAGRHGDAVADVTDALSRNPDFDQPAIPGERALWRYIRGAARAALGDPRARDDLREAVQDAPRDWVRARAHVELARLALRDGQTHGARAELDAAEHFGRRAGDDVAVERARRLRRGQQAP